MSLSIDRIGYSILLICLSTLGAANGAYSADLATSQWVYPGANGKLVYKTTPAGDRIMDFSYAGYMGGGVALPAVPVKRNVDAPAAEKADDDATAAIQAAIDEVAKLPLVDGFRGAVLLAPGTFNCAEHDQYSRQRHCAERQRQWRGRSAPYDDQALRPAAFGNRNSRRRRARAECSGFR